MLQQHTFNLYHIVTVYNAMFGQMHGRMRAFVKSNIQLKEDIFCSVKFAQWRLSKKYTEVTPSTVLLIISANILYPFRKVRSFRKWDKGLDINRQDKTCDTTQYQEAGRKDVQN
jgi:hypothetical protein